MSRTWVCRTQRAQRLLARAVALTLALITVETAWAQTVVMPAPTSVPLGGSGPVFSSRAAQRLGQPIGGFETVPAGDGTVIQGPLVGTRKLGYSTQSGVQMSLAANPMSQYGYQPVMVTAKLRQPATTDRTVRVRLTMGNYNARKSMVADAVLRFVPGDSSQSQTLLVPQYQDWPMCSWEVTVDRRVDDELTVDSGSFLQQQSNFIASGLVISDQPVPADLISSIAATTNGGANVRTRKLSELPENWLHYSTLDVAVIDVDELVKLRSQRRPAADALARWVRAGGNLWVLNAGATWEKMTEVERALGLRRQRGADDETPADDRSDRGSTDPADREVMRAGWTFAPLNELSQDPNEAALVLSGFDRGESTPTTSTPRRRPGQEILIEAESALRATAAELRKRVITSIPHFAVRSLGLGAVTAFRRDLRAPSGTSSTSVTTTIQQSLLQLRMTHGGRHGNRPDSANAEFNNWLIPGVGVAPVGQFQFLITMFVLAIGPLNYWWLKRQRKLPMLLVTVPVAAATVTLLLLAVGMLGDGISTRARTRSLTMLDQLAGESSTWSRQTYFAGISPRGGLNMPLDAALYPVLSEWSVGRYGQGSTVERRISWGRTQHLERGWLLSRTPTQYLVINARPNQKRLDLRPTPQGLRVINRLGTTVSHVVIQDHDGKVYWCEDLAPDQGQLLKETDANQLSGKLRQIFTDHEPAYPPGADTSWYGNRYYGEQLSTNVMETHLEAIYSPVVDRWANGSYIAITEQGIEVDYGVEDVIESDSLHVVCGTW